MADERPVCGHSRARPDGAGRGRDRPSTSSREGAATAVSAGPSGSSSQGRLLSPSSHRTGLVDLTSGSSGHRRSRNSIPVVRCRRFRPQLSQRQHELLRGNDEPRLSTVQPVATTWARPTDMGFAAADQLTHGFHALRRFTFIRFGTAPWTSPGRALAGRPSLRPIAPRPCLVGEGFPPSGPPEDLASFHLLLCVHASRTRCCAVRQSRTGGPFTTSGTSGKVGHESCGGEPMVQRGTCPWHRGACHGERRAAQRRSRAGNRQW
jgi:hypothetical protein